MMRKTGWASLLAVVACMSAPEAKSGVTAPFTFGSYYEQTGSGCTSATGGSATSTTACQLLFSGPPSGQVLRLANVNCTIQSNPAPLKSVYLIQNGNGSLVRRHALEPTPQGQQGGSFFYALNDDVDVYLVTVPVRIVAETAVASSIAMSCQIIGSVPSTGSV